MKWHCGVCLYIYKWLGFALKSNKCPVLLQGKSEREGSLRELFSQTSCLQADIGLGQKCATQGSPVVVSQSNFAKVFARFLGRLPLLIARFICHRQHSQTSPNPSKLGVCTQSVRIAKNKKDTEFGVLLFLVTLFAWKPKGGWLFIKCLTTARSCK